MHNTVATIHLKFKLSLSSGETPPFAAYIGCTNKSKLIFFRSPVLWEETELLQTSPAWQRQSVLLRLGPQARADRRHEGTASGDSSEVSLFSFTRKGSHKGSISKARKFILTNCINSNACFNLQDLRVLCLKTGLLCRAQTTVSYVLLLMDTNVPAAGQAQMLGLNKL